MCVGSVGVCKEGGTAETPPVGRGLGWGVLWLELQLDLLMSWVQVMNGTKCLTGTGLLLESPWRRAAPPDLLQGPGPKPQRCEVNLVQRALPGHRAGRADGWGTSWDDLLPV